jgi:DNA polymerase I
MWDLFPDEVTTPERASEEVDDLPHTSMSEMAAASIQKTPIKLEVGASFDLPDISYIKEAAELEKVLPRLLSAPTIGLDSETTGLDPLVDRLRTVQLATRERTVVVDAFHCPVEMLVPLMSGDRWLIGHNLKFDLKFLRQAGLPWPSTRCFDTMLGAQVLGASTAYGPKGTYSLDGVVKQFLNDHLDKSLQQSAWTGELSPEQIRYAAVDAAVLLPLATTLRAKLREARLWKVAELEGACVRALAWLELAGRPIDAEQWREQGSI